MVKNRYLNILKSNYLFSVGLFIVITLFFTAIFAPFIATHNPTEINLNEILMKPSLNHLFGTDELGRDVFSRVIHGSKYSLSIGFLSVGIAIFIGAILGLISGYFQGIVDIVIMRFVDIMLCFPSFFLILSVIAFLPPSIYNVMIIIGLTSWMSVARLVRAETMNIVHKDYITAAKLQNLPSLLIIFKHILPNVMSPIIVTAILGIAGAILTESALSFLGLGVQPPAPSWGNIITSGKDNIMFAWWLSLFPGLSILISVLGYNMLGDGLRDIIDAKTIKNE